VSAGPHGPRSGSLAHLAAQHHAACAVVDAHEQGNEGTALQARGQEAQAGPVRVDQHAAHLRAGRRSEGRGERCGELGGGAGAAGAG
jgi:hypothetical protein